MPFMLKLDREEVEREIAIFMAHHSGIQPFLIVSGSTLEYIKDQTNIPFALTGGRNRETTLEMFGVRVAIANSLRFGEFKVR